MTPARRRMMLLAAMAVTGAATRWVASDEHGTQSLAVPVVAATVREPAPRTTGEARSAVNLEKLNRPAFSGGPGDPFVTASWAPPASRPAASPAARAAPPVPFTFFGRMLEGGRTVVFLGQGLRTFTVGAGDTIDGVYRVERIGRENIVLTYLPLDQSQMLPIGAID